ncbi:hypothetical protein LMG28688_06498 [Paraburkholderia caffeinitolerans]|uniref:Uncharacterized protein n=1 Tax=Paraburkholderia caffeinitolerans TaxID=1723730 RepID=A0A6J5GVT1_9BURK|nr:MULTISPECIES: hypothetical protein [Paraburkholderia]CAB3807173.1 hypothetical protein LMG28688_06498 [Paraburkholderia caffeinitolerans]
MSKQANTEPISAPARIGFILAGPLLALYFTIGGGMLIARGGS